ncbi:MAG TPA: hypothetical protein PLP17_17315, partial [Oligoflexia bacterium]|nr:hypothetical protein [Oligoflexia bacterium]
MTSTSLEAPSFFVDLQVNGKWLGGVHADFSGPELSEAQARAIIEEALACGTVICPTTITQDTAQHCRNLGTISRALASVGMSGRWQHVEGPFFRATPALGAHPEKHVKSADIPLLERMIESSGDTIALLTVGPDVKNICALIEYAVEKGIVVSLGHHMAAPTQVDEAMAAGATWLTHLYNGIPLQVERQGILDFELDSALGAMLICDGTHVK